MASPGGNEWNKILLWYSSDGSETYIPELVSLWPREELDLNNGALYPWEWQGRFSRIPRGKWKSLADLVIQGLLNRRRNARLKKIILPSNGDRAEGVVKNGIAH